MIISNDGFKVLKNKENYIYTIIFPYYAETLIKSITKTKIITGVTVTDSFNKISFNAFIFTFS